MKIEQYETTGDKTTTTTIEFDSTNQMDINLVNILLYQKGFFAYWTHKEFDDYMYTMNKIFREVTIRES